MKPKAQNRLSFASTLLPLLTLGLVACVNTVRFPPDLWGWTDTWDTGPFTTSSLPQAEESGDTGFVAESVMVRRAWQTCDVDRQTLEVITTGWSAEVLLDVLHADGTAETHPLELVEVDPAGNYDVWAVELVLGKKPGDGITTFDCEADLAQLTHAIRLRTQTVALSDCGMWGVNPNQMTLWLTANEPAFTGTCRALEL